MMLGPTPTVRHERPVSVSTVVMSTRVTASVPWLASMMRTLKSVSSKRAISGYTAVSAARSAWSSALTGPLPSPTVVILRSPPARSLTIASASASVGSDGADATFTLHDSTVQYEGMSPISERKQQLERGVGGVEGVALRPRRS